MNKNLFRKIFFRADVITWDDLSRVLERMQLFTWTGLWRSINEAVMTARNCKAS
jgi:hypothetical protein